MHHFHAIILTIFPEMFPGPLSCSLAGIGLQKKIWSYETINIRNFGLTKHQNVDDKPFGGGNGLVMRPDVLGNALDFALTKYPDSTIYYPSPRGTILNQGLVKSISIQKNIIILCGRFEGIDERIIDEYNVCQVSVGNYILSGGEIAALSILDSAIRIIPGIVSNQESLKNESFEFAMEDGTKLLEYPLYTRPSNWKNRKVPEILLSGNHVEIDKWRTEKSIEFTKASNDKT